MVLDYKKLGFKCGLEIHQQLSGHKLFCNCPTEIRKDTPDFTIKRHLRASAGESGLVDRAAAHEQTKGKYFIYQGYYDTTCLVETDSEPPHPINRDAVNAAVQIAKLLNTKIADEIQVMRKVVIDGSNTSGFQRTMLIGRDGRVDVNGKKITIESVCLEEEACQIIERKKEYDVYNLSRLGIPLIEIATGPGISSPEECKAVAAKIGMILRSVPGCKRGIGTIRQDVNLSIKGGSRIEIKGFQDLRSIPKIIAYEINRQLKEIKKGKKIENHVRKAEADLTTSYLRPMPGADRMYPETDIPNFVPDLKSVGKVKLIDDEIEEIVKKFGLNKDIAALIVKNKIDLAGYVKKYRNIKPLFIAETLLNTPKELKKRYKADIDIIQHADEVFEKLNKGHIPKGAVFHILLEIAQGKKPDYSKYAAVSEGALEQDIKSIVDNNQTAPIGALMGMIMAKYRGKIDGSKAMQLLQKYKK